MPQNRHMVMNRDASPAIHAVIPAAGHGSRAGSAQPKQFRHVAGQTLLAHTLQALAGVHRLAHICVVLAPGERFEDLPDGRFVTADCGGPTRAVSVLNGLDHVLRTGATPADWVLVHDAARCLVRPEWVQALIDAVLAANHGLRRDDPPQPAVGGLLALPAADTLKRADERGRVRATVPRSDMWLAQTPQMFPLGLLRAALAQALDAQPDAVTDEASAMEMAGHQPLLVPGHPFNIKVTWPEDFALAEALLKDRTA